MNLIILSKAIIDLGVECFQGMKTLVDGTVPKVLFSSNNHITVFKEYSTVQKKVFRY